MTDIKRTVSILFSGRDELSKEIRNIAGSMDKFDAIAQNIAAPLSRMTDLALGLDAALAALAAAGLTYAFLKAKDFENATIELNKVLGDQEKILLPQLQQEASNLALAYGESSATVLLAAANFVQAGYSAEEGMTLTKDAMDLVIAGSIESAQASELLISILKGFKAPATEATRVIDILNEVSNRYATDVEQLAIGMATLSPIARQMGFSFEETAGVLTPVIEIFRSGDEAAIALKTGLLRLVDDSKPVQEALRAIGVSQYDANGHLRSGKDILHDVSVAFQTASDADKMFLATQLAGIHQAAKMVEVFNNLAYSTEITAVAMGSAGSASTEVALRMASAEVALKRVKVAWDEVAIAAGQKFLEATKGVLVGLADIEKALLATVKSGAFDELFGLLNEWADKLGKFLTEVAPALPEAFAHVDFSKLIDALRDLAAEFGIMFKGIDLTTPEGLADAIQTAVNSLASLVKVTQGIVIYFEPIFAAIREGIVEFGNMSESAQFEFGKVLGAAKLVTEAGVYIASALIAISEAGADIGRIFDVVIGGIGIVWNAMETAFNNVVVMILYEAEKVLWLAEKMAWFPGLFTDVDENIAESREELKRWRQAAEEMRLEDFREAADAAARAWGGITGNVDEAKKAIQSGPGKGGDWEVPIDPAFSNDWWTLEEQIQSIIPKEQTMTVAPTVDEWALYDAANTIQKVIPEQKQEEVIVTLDDGSVWLTNKTIEDILPGDKLGFIPRQVAVSADKESIQNTKDYILKEMEALSKTEQVSIEWNAKINIASIEAATKKWESSLTSINTGLESTADIVSSAFSAFGEAGPLYQREILDIIDREQAMRETLLDSQTKLMSAQIRIEEARAKALERGDALIKIDATGLEPALELVMFQILQKVQIRANEAEAEFLLGIS